MLKFVDGFPTTTPTVSAAVLMQLNSDIAVGHIITFINLK